MGDSGIVYAFFNVLHESEMSKLKCHMARLECHMAKLECHMARLECHTGASATTRTTQQNLVNLMTLPSRLSLCERHGLESNNLRTKQER